VSQVDFYILSGRGETSRAQFACKLAEKAWRLNNSVHIRVANTESEKMLDDLLWTFRDGSFVPHEIIDSSSRARQSPVTIACTRLPASGPDLLINLGDSIPDNSTSFARVAEVVSSDEESLNQSRQRFVDYRDQGHTLGTHKL